MKLLKTIGMTAALVLNLAFSAGDVSAAGLTMFEAEGDLSASASIVPSTDGKRGWSGYTVSAEFTCPKPYDGPVVAKPGVFSFDVSGSPDNRLYRFRLFGSHASDPKMTEISYQANAETDPTAPVHVAWVCSYCLEPEQSHVGYRIILYVNGEMIGSSGCCSRFFTPETKRREPVALSAEAGVRRVSLAGRACSPGELFSVAAPLKWTERKAGVRIIETPQLKVAVAERPVKGNPILGVWNRVADCPLTAEDGLGWGVAYAGEDGTLRQLRSNSRKLVSEVEFRKGGFVVTSRGSGLVVRHGVRIEGCRIDRRLEVEDTLGSRVCSLVFPRANLLKLPGKDTLLEAQFSGVRTDDPTTSYQFGGSWYPGGWVTMPFAAYYNDRGNGVYFGMEDPKAASKSYSANGCNGRLSLAFEASVSRDAGQPGAKRCASSGCGVLELYRGQWYEAGQVYRKFLQASAPWYDRTLPRTDTPEWFRRNPLWVVCLNLLHGRKPAARFFADYFEVPTSFVTGVTGTPDGRGGYGPNYIVRGEPEQCYRELQREGMHFVAYTNPRLWYAVPGKAEESNNYSKTGKLWSVKDEKGEPRIEFYGERYVVPCPATPQWRDHLCRRTKMLADHALDGIYHDQISCSTPYVCFDATHGHPAGDPAAWYSGGLWKFCDYLMGDLRKEFPALVHTGEDASEPFVNRLDGFVTWRFGRSNHVPLFQSLYAPRIQFVGRGCDTHRVPGSYESFFPKYAEQLCYGEQIGWVHFKTLAYPSPRRGYLKKLAHCRYALADFLNASEMEKPLDFARQPETFQSIWGVDAVNATRVDKVLTSAWRNVDGRQLVMFLNTVNEPQEVVPAWDRGGKMFAVCRERSSRPETVAAPPKGVRLAPYGFEFWIVDDRRGAVARGLAPTLARAATFLRTCRGGMISQPPAFKKTVTVDATDGKPVTADGAAWGLRAFIPEKGQFDHSSALPSTKDGWIAAMDGGIVSYGTVDFGTGAKAVEFDMATDEKGVAVAFYDVTGDVPERKIAEFRPEPGDWHGYRPQVSPLFGEVTGKRDVICRVTGGICNLKNWKTLKTGKPGVERPVAKEAPGKIDFTVEKRFNGASGIPANDAAWTLFARREADGVRMTDAGIAYYDVVDFGRNPSAVEIEVTEADPQATIEVVDLSEFAPATPLAQTKATKGRMTAPLTFKVEGCRNIALAVRNGSCRIASWRVVGK